MGRGWGGTCAEEVVKGPWPEQKYLTPVPLVSTSLHFLHLSAGRSFCLVELLKSMWILMIC